MHNATFWRRYFKSSFVPHLERTLDALECRILPAFSEIEEEATAVQRATHDEFMSRPADPDADPFVVSETAAEAAFEAGFDHYSGMQAVKQSLLNSLAAILYHAWEQQLLTFHRREVLRPEEEGDNQLLQLKVLQKRVEATGVDITLLPAWATIEELRLVANTVKHADGVSADQLKQRRQELFEQHGVDCNLELTIPYRRRVYKPLSGEDIYLTLADLRLYGRATISFWEEFADALDRVRGTD